MRYRFTIGYDKYDEVDSGKIISIDMTKNRGIESLFNLLCMQAEDLINITSVSLYGCSDTDNFYQGKEENE